MCSCCESPGCRAEVAVQAECLAAASANAERAERQLTAALARVAQLEAALRDISSDCGVMAERNPGMAEDDFHAIWQRADAALAANPTSAWRRWEAMREVCEAARVWTDAADYRADREARQRTLDALARLDAEGR